MKSQWYKSLNGGNCFNPEVNLKNGQRKFGIDEGELKIYSKQVKIVMTKITLLKELRKFQRVLNDLPMIYLPTIEEPFKTDTLSKTQEEEKKKKQKKKKEQKKTKNRKVEPQCPDCLQIVKWQLLQCFMLN